MSLTTATEWPDLDAYLSGLWRRRGPSDPSGGPRSLVEVLRWRARHQPARQALIFLSDGEGPDVDMTYAELDRQARTVGALLQGSGATGARVLLLYPPGLPYIAAFLGCLYAGAVAVPAYPPRLNRPTPRLETIVSDAQATVALTTTATLSAMRRLFPQPPYLERLRWIATDAIDEGLADGWREPRVTDETLAFLQYTSGSTATPKGVMITHRNLLHNLSLIYRYFAHTPDSRGVIWLPPYHDMGLIGGILQPLYGGFPTTLLSPVAFLQRPYRWLETIARTRATTSGAPNFAYDLCVRATTPAQRAALDLRCWDVAFTGAEPIRSETLRRFADAFAPCGFRTEAFYPCYGLAEATLIAAGGHTAAAPRMRAFDAPALEVHRVVAASAGDDGARTLVGCGSALPDQRIEIVDPATLAPCAPGEVGEIWLAGPSVARGYWGRPEDTAHVFDAHLSDTGAGPFLRTGDLGFVDDGELFVTGRLKDLIIIHGRNHYPQDIEVTVDESHPALRAGAGAAFTVETAGEERLVIVQELDRQRRTEDVVVVGRAIRQAIAERHGIHAHAVALLKPGSIPKTSSGKIQRQTCRQGFIDGTLAVIGSDIHDETHAADVIVRPSRDDLLALPAEARRAWIERYLRESVARLLGVSVDSIDVTQPLIALGMASLMAMELKSALESGLDVAVSMTSLLDDMSVALLTTALLTQLSAPLPPPRPLPHATRLTSTPRGDVDGAGGGAYPLSHGQRALWFLQHLAPTSVAGTIARAFHVRGALDDAALQRAFQALVARHAALRATFPARDGDPTQHIHAHVAVPFVRHDATEWSEAQVRERLTDEARRPFDLERGPVVRLHLFTRSARAHVLLVAMHHIVTDAGSLRILFSELALLYAAEKAGDADPLPPRELAYTDYVRWQRELVEGPDGERLWSYWRQQLAGAPPVVALSADRPRPSVPTFAGAATTITLGTDLTADLHRCARRAGVTLFTLLLAAFQTLLARYSGQDDIVVGSPLSGRSRRPLEDVVGYITNPLPLRTSLAGDPPFSALLGRVRDTVAGALAHQDYPFPLLVERLQPERAPGHAPLFQILFVLHQGQRPGAVDLTPLALNGVGGQVHLDDLALEPIPLNRHAAQVDLTLEMAEVVGDLVASFEYSTELFDADTIARLATHYRTLLDGIVASPDQRISTLPLLTMDERERILGAWNDTRAPYPPDRCVHHLVEEHAARRPDELAVVFEGERLTYGALDARASRLAWYLRGQGVGPAVLVGLCVERSLDMVVGLLGILKAGGAYVPLDPTYPQERLRVMLADAQAPVVVTQQGLRDRLSDYAGHVVCLDTDVLDVPDVDLTRLMTSVGTEGASVADAAAPANLAYVIYTSGSTGRPKGVLMPHRTLSNLIAWQRRQDTAPVGRRTLQWAPLSFDVSVQEIFSTWCAGGTLVLVPESVRRDSVGLLQLLIDARVERLYLPVVALQHLAEVAQDKEALPTSLREVITAGEQLRITAPIVRLFERLPDCTLHNHYGPTESHVVTAHTLRGAPRAWPGLPPIGRPIANTTIYLLDERLQPVPVGVAGELYIGGAGLARGYHNRPGLTAERFIPHPFDEAPDARLYKTGDLARYRPDGTIEFLGRRDDQVKIRGYRVEPGEIETVLRAHPAVADAVVLAREDTSGDLSLVAYVVLAPAYVHMRFSVRDLRHVLSHLLPAYMLPSVIMPCEALPLTPSGKVDRRALPAPDTRRPTDDDTVVAPDTPLQRQVAHIWEDLLGVRPIGVTDDFFAMGGHSLLAVRMLDRVARVCGREVPLAMFFGDPTIERLAQAILRQEAPDEQRARYPHLAAVHTEGTKQPFFYVTGDASYYLDLIRRLDPDRPVYVLEPHGIHDLPGALTIEAMAADHMRTLQAMQPEGPYLLGGYSNGGLVTYEMARRLRAHGHRVDLLVLVDVVAVNARFSALAAYGRRVGRVAHIDTATPRAIFFRARDYSLRWYFFRRAPRAEQRTRIVRAGRRTIRTVVHHVLARTVRGCMEARPRSGATTDEVETRHNEWLDSYARAVTMYIPRPYAGRVTLLRASDGVVQLSKEPTAGWRRVAADVTTHDIPGTHVSCVREYVHVLAGRLQECLNDVEEAHQD